MDLSNCTWVFVGCGGTFYCAVPPLATLLRAHRPHLAVFVDPDKLEPQNLDRQWSNYNQYNAKLYKADMALRQTLPTDCPGDWYCCVFPAERLKLNGPVLLIVNTDNNDSRMDCRQWCLNHSAETAMIVSGCDGAHGQVVWGLYGQGPTGEWGEPTGPACVDWLERHPDVDTDRAEDSRDGGCGGQTVYANALTAALLPLAIGNLAAYLKGESHPKEYYWRIGRGRLTASTVVIAGGTNDSDK